MKIKAGFLAIVVVLIGIIIFLSSGVQKNFDRSMGPSPTPTAMPSYPPIDYSFTLYLQPTSGNLVPKFNMTVTIPDKTTHLVNREKTTMTFTGTNFSLKFRSEADGGPANYEEPRPIEKLENTKLGIPLYRLGDVSTSYLYADEYKTGKDCGTYTDFETKETKTYADCSFNIIWVRKENPSDSAIFSVYCDPSSDDGLKACDEIMKSLRASLI